MVFVKRPYLELLIEWIDIYLIICAKSVANYRH